MRLQYVIICCNMVCLCLSDTTWCPYNAIHSSFKVPSHGDWEEQFSWLGEAKQICFGDLWWSLMIYIILYHSLSFIIIHLSLGRLSQFNTCMGLIGLPGMMVLTICRRHLAVRWLWLCKESTWNDSKWHMWRTGNSQSQIRYSFIKSTFSGRFQADTWATLRRRH